MPSKRKNKRNKAPSARQTTTERTSGKQDSAEQPSVEETIASTNLTGGPASPELTDVGAACSTETFINHYAPLCTNTATLPAWMWTTELDFNWARMVRDMEKLESNRSEPLSESDKVLFLALTVNASPRTPPVPGRSVQNLLFARATGLDYLIEDPAATQVSPSSSSSPSANILAKAAVCRPCLPTFK
ncbi:hypothetical protein OQA88_9523 [Cercophora sp. LCS_1]